MASEERERQFERALQRQMRGGTPEAACPDAETLAAYHERTLSLEELAKWKEHITACTRCQETLALVEETSSIALHDWEKKGTARAKSIHEGTVMVPQTSRSVREEAFEQAAESLPQIMGAATRQKEKVIARASWKWVAPVGALAAGLLVFVAVRETRQQGGNPQPAVYVAQNRDVQAPKQKSKEVPLLPKTEERAQSKFDSGGALGQKAMSMPRKMSPTTGAKEPLRQEGIGTGTGGGFGTGVAANQMNRSAREEKAAANRLEAGPISSDAAAATERSRADLGAARPASAPPAASPRFNHAARTPTPGAVPPAEAELDKKKADGVGNGYGKTAGAPATAPRMTSDKSAKDSTGAVSAQNRNVGGASGATRNEPKPAAKSVTGGVSAITGTVLDPSGTAVRGAVITAIDTRSGNSKTTVADAAGKFQLMDLPSDQYRVLVAQTGFAQSEQTLTLQPLQNEQLRVQLTPGAATESVEVTSAAPVLNTESASASTAATGASPSASKLPTNGRNLFSLVQLAAGNPQYIVVPGQKVGWRVGRSGKIERSTDRGMTWKPQNSGVSADLTTGSASTERICWVIGKTGMIVLTTDGGKHWKQVRSPLTEELGGVHAVDAKHASIWNVAKNKSFETADGGVTWTPAANE